MTKPRPKASRNPPPEVRLVPVDSPGGLVIRVIDAKTGEQVRPSRYQYPDDDARSDEGPLHFSTQQAAIVACNDAGLKVLSATECPGAANGEGQPVVIGETVVVNPSPPSYRAAHWGVDATSRKPLDIPDPRANRKKRPPMIGLGELVAVTYGTIKGGDGGKMTDYVHTFESRRPVLCYGAVDGRLYIAGGSYSVSTRGIIG